MSIQAEIRKTYGDFKLDIKLDSSSKRIGILGASGCGKSMTLKKYCGDRAAGQRTDLYRGEDRV